MQTDTDLASSFERVLTQFFGSFSANLWFLAGLVLLATTLLMLWRLTSLARSQRVRIRQLESKLHGATVRRGYASEALAPLLDSFPVDVGKPGSSTLFVGQPVDYIHFDEDEGVTFIEIKSGNSQLSQRQRRLRDLIQRGAVDWKTMNVTTRETAE